MMSVVNVTAIVLLLVMSSLACDQEQGADQMRKPPCLEVTPEESCNVIVTYPDPDLSTLECDALIPAEDGSFLADQPKIEVVDPTGEFPVPVLVVMFDPDLPTTDLAEGFIHWVARGKMEEGGLISDLISLPELEYYPPNTGEADMVHRYQVYVFKMDADKDIAANPSPNFIRLDHLCYFINRNLLGYPIASTQFRYRQF